MEVQAALGSDIALVFDECTPFHAGPRVHRALDRAHAPLARPLPGLARASTDPRGRSSTGSSRAASTRTCAAPPRRRSPRAARRRDRDRRHARRGQGRRCSRSSSGRSRSSPEARAAPPARDRRDRRPRARRRARHRHVRLRDADPDRPPRHGASCPIRSKRWRVDLAKARWQEADEPLLEGCPCPACAHGYSRAYLHYLLKAQGADRACAC